MNPVLEARCDMFGKNLRMKARGPKRTLYLQHIAGDSIADSSTRVKLMHGRELGHF